MKYSRIILICTLFSLSTQLRAQNKYITRSGTVTFFSATSAENIDATNNEALSMVDITKGEVAFQVLVTGFKFKKALMEEHFNENYIESNKYPKSTFKGTVSDISKVNFSSDGNYPVTVNGDLTIHGVTKNVTASGNIIIKGSKITISSKFMAKLADYGISIPGAVKSNISESVEIAVNCNLDQKM